LTCLANLEILKSVVQTSLCGIDLEKLKRHCALEADQLCCGVRVLVLIVDI